MTKLPDYYGLEERTEKVVKGANSYEDDRGLILNYDLPESVNLLATITSKKGTLRANHFHPIQEQKVLVISGKFISLYRDLFIENSIVKHHLIESGDLVVTPPGMAHAMIFLEDCTFINLVNGNRDHDKYAKEHTFPYQLVKQEDIKKYISQYE